MKRLCLSALCAFGLFFMADRATAQDWLPSYKLGATAGLNVSNFSHSGYDSKCGFQLGLDAMFDMTDFVDNTYLRTGLLFSRKGARIDGGSHGQDVKFRTCYLELPIRYGYGYVFDPDFVLYGELGPYFAVGLGGKMKRDVEGGGTYSHDFFEGDTKRFDFGLGFHAGVILQKVHQIGIGYDFGYVNMSDAYEQNRNFSMAYTYYFK